MNTKMHRVTEDLAQTFREHEGDDLAASNDDATDYIEELSFVVVTSATSLLSLIVAALGIALVMGWV